MSGLLDRIVAQKREAHARRAPRPLAALWEEVTALAPARPFTAALRRSGRPGVRVIAEFKRRSPSAGAIRPGADPAVIARGYERGGAAAMSVLTDEPFFDGRLADLGRVRAACGLPLLRKDFLLDERDLLEARLAGADAVLLIVRLLEVEALTTLLAVARRAGLDALVEAHSDEEIDRARDAGAALIGVNHRDLDTLTIDLSLSARARARLPDAVLVAESGIQTRAQVAAIAAQGIDAILIGESLMRAPDPGAALAELLA